jgi:hypothetical protein
MTRQAGKRYWDIPLRADAMAGAGLHRELQTARDAAHEQAIGQNGDVATCLQTDWQSVVPGPEGEILDYPPLK